MRFQKLGLALWLFLGAACLAQPAEIFRTIQPTLDTTSKYTQRTAPARSVDELQRQIAALMHDKETEALYEKANQDLNKMAKIEKRLGPYDIANFSEVSPGIYRSATPTLEQAEQILKSKKIGLIISMNGELTTGVKLDPGHTAPLTPEREKIMRDKLLATGKKEERAEFLVQIYRDYLTYAQAVAAGKRSDLKHVPLSHPEEDMAGYFTVLEKIFESKRAHLPVLFHCNVGKHRTGLIAMLVQTLNADAHLSKSEVDALYLEFVQRNWNERASTRIHYMIVYSLIVQSKPFLDLNRKWNAKSPS